MCVLSPWKFQCSDKSGCLNSSQVCDSQDDCQDKSDETNCPTLCQSCAIFDFRCHKTCQCLPVTFVCDGGKDCNDGSDELGCPTLSTTTTTTTTHSPTTVTTQTSSTKLTTQSTIRPTTIPSCNNNKIYKQCKKTCEPACQYLSKYCIENNRLCTPGCGCPSGLINNGTYCVLASSCSCYDEINKVYHDAGERWEEKCKVCTCFNNSIKCQKKECPDPYCPSPHVLTKQPGDCCATCITGSTVVPSTTIPTTTPPSCLLSEFMCSDHKCIPKQWRCDGERDCYDAGDERNCTTRPPTCMQPLGKYQIILERFVNLTVDIIVYNYYFGCYDRMLNRYPTM